MSRVEREMNTLSFGTLDNTAFAAGDDYRIRIEVVPHKIR